MTLTSDDYVEKSDGGGKTLVALTYKPQRPLVGASSTSVSHRQLDDVLGFLAHLKNHLGNFPFYEHRIAPSVVSGTRRLLRQLYVHSEGWCRQIACCPPRRARMGCAALSQRMKDLHQVHRTMRDSSKEVVAAVADGRIAPETFDRPVDGNGPGCNENLVYIGSNAPCRSGR